MTDVESAFQKNEAKWKVSEKNVQNAQGFFNEAIILKLGIMRADVIVTILESSKQAAEQFEGEKVSFIKLSEKDAIKSELENFGDENFMLTGKRQRKWCNIFLRQNNVLIKVFAPSAETAKRFIGYIVDLMPPSNKSLQRSATTDFHYAVLAPNSVSSALAQFNRSMLLFMRERLIL